MSTWPNRAVSSRHRAGPNAINPTSDANEVISAVNKYVNNQLCIKQGILFRQIPQIANTITSRPSLDFSSEIPGKKETEAREKDAEPDKNKAEVNPLPPYTLQQYIISVFKYF